MIAIKLNNKFYVYKKCPICKKNLVNKKIGLLKKQIFKNKKIKLNDFKMDGKNIKIIEKCKCGEEIHYLFDIYKPLKEKIK